MSINLLNIGKSGLMAAQLGLATTGHNISNANVTGYSRQTVLQRNAVPNQAGYGFVGTGTEVAQVKRVYDNFLANQVRAAQSASSGHEAVYTQISQIDNLLADPSAGLSPSLQEFFKSVQDVSANPASVASRQALLSGAGSLASRFQGLTARLREIGNGVTSEIKGSVASINSFATQIAELNASISNLGVNETNLPNDLLDQRDQLINEMSKYVKVTVTPGENNSVTVAIGSGQPLVLGKHAFQLATTPALTNPDRLEVGYMIGDTVSVLGEGALNGGSLGGLLEFRSGTLDRVQNSLGRLAVTMAITFNDQHKLGQDQNGAPGGAFFSVAAPVVAADYRNNATSTAAVTATISDPTKLTVSDYAVRYDGADFVVTRQSDGQRTTIAPYPQSGPQTIDGVDFSISGSAAEADNFMVKPTANGAAGFNVLITDRAKIAAAAPVSTSSPLANTGNAKISAGSVDSAYLLPGNTLAAPVTLTYNLAGNSLSGFPPGQAVTVTANGVPTVYPAGTASIPYTNGAELSFGGVHVAIAGTPGAGDQFSVGPNVSGVGDNRNMALLGALQTKNILDGGKATYQGAYAETVSFVGNTTREVQINGLASTALLEQTETAQQSLSGVNLDEEAANLLRYQQAYQASGKVMQLASTLFDVIIGLGR
ncbi:flagellar hook-associated protein 1 [Janthinobacterium sp. CG_23.3]|uniref:flagellar hook-associated protein FlgK n=1 Tax=unclassified Janthinobacterium TaxID=2610881 RepID=UPI000347CCEA|nr:MULTISPECIES: flagellar hook-associated protein FlgK [unclassified Janthinobacterium]MEC5162262.1 flagellar hook-associated protein 1 FlgK [Janthinobacterium sp. CG_S6]